MVVLNVISHSEEQTEALAQKLSVSFVAGDVLVLSGSLGSGKTTFVRGLVSARGVSEDAVRSPSYAFVNEYASDPPLYHFDLYRLGNTSELQEIGWDEYLGRAGITVVEWGERAAEMLPDRYYHVKFAIRDEHERQIDISLVQP
ncbi:MAG: tRNA (adenosine(37)-N6)-threonylcarbamoyltransferase complex ATPase subunit type 1 TsaE [Candidatus Zixiibacteriota bacterium]|nr:MAG: tRNA (adenosine(37)-N6)-threonylcarbamoyltransferase complex ATPase subunit type 1 TsaE [candidate division Zixibacteria bacterium]